MGIMTNEEMLIYPILASEIEVESISDEYMPILSTEIETKTEDSTAEDIASYTEGVPTEIDVVESNESDTSVDCSESILNWVSHFVDRLEKDHIVVDDDAKVEVIRLFNHAMDNGDIAEEPVSDEYIKDVVLKMEFQLMLKGNGEDDKVSNSDVKQLIKDLFGEQISTKSVIKEKKRVNVVATIPTSEQKNNDKEASISAQYSAEKVGDVLTGSKSMQDTRIVSNKSGEVKSTTSTGNTFSSVFEALKAYGEFPTKKDDQKKKVPDTEYIDKISSAITKTESIVYASYYYTCYIKAEKIKGTKNDIMKLPFMDNAIQIMVITEENIYICKTYDKEPTVIARKDIVGVQGVYEKKMGSLGQIQIELQDDYFLVLTINRFYSSGMSEKEQYDSTVEYFTNLFEEDLRKNSGDDFKEELRLLTMQKKELSRLIADPEAFGGDRYSLEDRLIIKTILDMGIEQYENILNADQEPEGFEKLSFYVMDAMINRKLNMLIGAEIFTVCNNWNEMGEGAIRVVDALMPQFAKQLDELEEQCREAIRNDFGNGNVNSSGTSYSLDELILILDSMEGVDAAKKELHSLISLAKANEAKREAGLPELKLPPRHMVYVGGYGTGKSTVAYLVSRIFANIGFLSKGQLLEVPAQDLIGKSPDESEHKALNCIGQAVGGVLYIDNAHELVCEENQTFIDTLLTMIERYSDDLIVILASDDEKIVESIRNNTSLALRFRKIIEFPDFTANQMMNIFKRMLEANDLKLDSEAVEVAVKYFEKAEKNAGYGNARGVRNTLEELMKIQSIRVAELENATVEVLKSITKEDFYQLDSSLDS